MKGILVIGLYNSGKTSIIRKLKTGKFSEDSLPTLGYSIDVFTNKGKDLQFFDIGGAGSYRDFANVFLPLVNNVILVVDVSESSHYGEAREYLRSLIEQKELDKLSTAIFANKIDQLEDFSEDELLSYLELGKDNHRIKIFKTSAKTGEGIQEGIDWLIKGEIE
ncbi:MAG: ADP-ribosylation factor-like protein [Candidatus Hodarchaeota archaeon]